MEYENKLGNKNNLAKLKVRVEEYLTQFYGNNKSEGEDSDQE
jgi:predicted GNAT superfamily acetyltransferase